MERKRTPLFTVLGIPIFVDASWVAVAVLITWSLATGVFPAALPGASVAVWWGMGAAGALGLFASVLLHELAHSVVALRYGVGIRGITLWLFGGVAEMKSEPPGPRAELWIAAAGPALSFVLGGVLHLAAAGLVAAELAAPATTVLRHLGTLNLILGGFNLLPAFPLDGGRVLRAALWAWRQDLVGATRITSRLGSFFGALLIGLGGLSLLGGDVLGGLWIGLIGLFLRNAARSSYESLLVSQVMKGMTVDRVMSRPVVSVPAGTSLQELVDDYVYRFHHKLFPVVDDSGRLVGAIKLRQVAEVPKHAWALRTAREVMTPVVDVATLPPSALVTEALERMNATDESRLLIADGEAVVGVVALKDLLEVVTLRLRLEGELAGRAPAA